MPNNQGIRVVQQVTAPPGLGIVLKTRSGKLHFSMLVGQPNKAKILFNREKPSLQVVGISVVHAWQFNLHPFGSKDVIAWGTLNRRRTSVINCDRRLGGKDLCLLRHGLRQKPQLVCSLPLSCCIISNHAAQLLNHLGECRPGHSAASGVVGAHPVVVTCSRNQC